MELMIAFHLLQQRQSVVQHREEDDEEESDLEFESDEDSDDDYEDSTLKPWQKKKATKTSSRLDKAEEPSASSDEEMAEAGKERAPPVAAELDDYIRVTLPRRRLARWCHEPYFDRAVIGCFVRLFIGESEDGKKCYRLCEIVDVDKSKSEYKFPVASSKEQPVRFGLIYSYITFSFLCSHFPCLSRYLPPRPSN